MATTDQERLTEAQQALHDLLSGQAVAQVTDQNGESVRYVRANVQSLLTYIEDLQRRVSTTTTTGPLQIWF